MHLPHSCLRRYHIILATHSIAISAFNGSQLKAFLFSLKPELSVNSLCCPAPQQCQQDVCVRACVRACMCACARACVCVCVFKSLCSLKEGLTPKFACSLSLIVVDKIRTHYSRFVLQYD